MGKFSDLCNSIFDFGTKNSNERVEKITKITPHHMAGNLTSDFCAKMHYNGDCSANYYIGTDGKITGGVSETRRAWTSSSSWNDQRAITFEVANNTFEPNWGISDAAYNSLVKLCADICKRYNINPHFDGTTNGSITMHKQYAATACPGPTLEGYIRSGKLENDIKAAMGTQPAPEPTDETVYIVQPGDTLSAIANKYNTTVDKLVALNDIDDPDLIYVGDKIKVTDNNVDYYIVQLGDTLTAIARKYNTTVYKLKTINNIPNANLIYVGQKIKVR